MTDKLQTEVTALKARVRQLEDALLQFAPFAVCHNVEMNVTIRTPDDETTARQLTNFKRDTLFMDKHSFREAAALVADRLRANGTDDL